MSVVLEMNSSYGGVFCVFVLFTVPYALGRDPDLKGMVVFDGEVGNIIPYPLGRL